MKEKDTLKNIEEESKMLNSVPIIGWLLSLLFTISLAIPFYFMWNHVGPIYFYWLPQVYKNIPFWDCVWLFTVISILKSVLVPKFVDVTQNNNKEN